MKQFNIQQFLDDFGVPYEINGKMLQAHCPRCIRPGTRPKLGIYRDYGNAVCLKCGRFSRHEIVETFANGNDLKQIYENYSGETYIGNFQAKEKIRGGATSIDVPGTSPLNKKAREYLIDRNFDPDVLEQLFKIRSTDHIGEHNFRIVIPIIQNNRIVSYTCRDYTNKRPKAERYLTCRPEKEIVFHKSILYNMDNCTGDTFILVEGPIDTWPFRKDVCASFSSTVTDEQLYTLRNKSRGFIMFDPEPDAQAKAKKAAEKLSSYGIDMEVLDIGSGDPGQFSDSDVIYLRKELGLY